MRSGGLEATGPVGIRGGLVSVGSQHLGRVGVRPRLRGSRAAFGGEFGVGPGGLVLDRRACKRLSWNVSGGYGNEHVGGVLGKAPA